MCKFILTLFLVLLAPFSMAEELDEKMEKGFIEFNFGDRKKGIEIIKEVLQQDPENIEALWLMAYQDIKEAYGHDLENKSKVLAYGTGAIKNIVSLAHSKGEHAMAHYIDARLADLYLAYDRAIVEIDKAIAIEPLSARYYRTKGRIFFDRAKWENDEKYIKLGLIAFEKAIEILSQKKSIYTNEGELYFSMARWYPTFADDAYESIIKYYNKAIETGKLTKKFKAFAWNNMSNNYREIGKCAEAKEAAEKALTFFKFGMAKKNLFYSNSCLELEQLNEFKS